MRRPGCQLLSAKSGDVGGGAKEGGVWEGTSIEYNAREITFQGGHFLQKLIFVTCRSVVIPGDHNLEAGNSKRELFPPKKILFKCAISGITMVMYGQKGW